MQIVDKHHFASVAFPVLGAGSGSFDTQNALDLMCDEFDRLQSVARVTIVRFVP